MEKTKLEQLNYQKKKLHAKTYFKHKFYDLMIVVNKDSVHLVQSTQKIELSFDEIDAIYDEVVHYKQRVFVKNERYQQENGAFLTIQKVKKTSIYYILDGEDELNIFDEDSVFARTLTKPKG